ncbi:MAG: hypothetical protein JNL67_20550 [Planctomycetaceae bacterium]|nr:hypothetical protein [Planctomycetaceae bacterium]
MTSADHPPRRLTIRVLLPCVIGFWMSWILAVWTIPTASTRFTEVTRDSPDHSREVVRYLSQDLESTHLTDRTVRLLWRLPFFGLLPLLLVGLSLFAMTPANYRGHLGMAMFAALGTVAIGICAQSRPGAPFGWQIGEWYFPTSIFVSERQVWIYDLILAAIATGAILFASSYSFGVIGLGRPVANRSEPTAEKTKPNSRHSRIAVLAVVLFVLHWSDMTLAKYKAGWNWLPWFSIAAITAAWLYFTLWVAAFVRKAWQSFLVMAIGLYAPMVLVFGLCWVFADSYRVNKFQLLVALMCYSALILVSLIELMRTGLRPAFVSHATQSNGHVPLPMRNHWSAAAICLTIWACTCGVAAWVPQQLDVFTYITAARDAWDRARFVAGFQRLKQKWPAAEGVAESMAIPQSWDRSLLPDEWTTHQVSQDFQSIQTADDVKIWLPALRSDPRPIFDLLQQHNPKQTTVNFIIRQPLQSKTILQELLNYPNVRVHAGLNAIHEPEILDHLSSQNLRTRSIQFATIGPQAWRAVRENRPFQLQLYHCELAFDVVQINRLDHFRLDYCTASTEDAWNVLPSGQPPTELTFLEAPLPFSSETLCQLIEKHSVFVHGRQPIRLATNESTAIYARIPHEDSRHPRLGLSPREWLKSASAFRDADQHKVDHIPFVYLDEARCPNTLVLNAEWDTTTSAEWEIHESVTSVVVKFPVGWHLRRLHERLATHTAPEIPMQCFPNVAHVSIERQQLRQNEHRSNESEELRSRIIRSVIAAKPLQTLSFSSQDATVWEILAEIDKLPELVIFGRGLAPLVGPPTSRSKEWLNKLAQLQPGTNVCLVLLDEDHCADPYAIHTTAVWLNPLDKLLNSKPPIPNALRSSWLSELQQINPKLNYTVTK